MEASAFSASERARVMERAKSSALSPSGKTGVRAIECSVEAPRACANRRRSLADPHNKPGMRPGDDARVSRMWSGESRASLQNKLPVVLPALMRGRPAPCRAQCERGESEAKPRRPSRESHICSGHAACDSAQVRSYRSPCSKWMVSGCPNAT